MSPCHKGSGTGSKGLGGLTGDKSRRRTLLHHHMDISQPCLSTAAAHKTETMSRGQGHGLPSGAGGTWGTEKGRLSARPSLGLRYKVDLGSWGLASPRSICGQQASDYKPRHVLTQPPTCWPAWLPSYKMELESAAWHASLSPKELGSMTDGRFPTGSHSHESKAVMCLGKIPRGQGCLRVPASPLLSPTGGGQQMPGQALQDHNKLFSIIHSKCMSLPPQGREVARRAGPGGVMGWQPLP